MLVDYECQILDCLVVMIEYTSACLVGILGLVIAAEEVSCREGQAVRPKG